MKYNKTITLKDGRECILRNGTKEDGAALLDNFITTHAQTDFLASYPDECTMTAEAEGEFLEGLEKSANEVELLAFVGEACVGSAGFHAMGSKTKVRHRCDFGISVDESYWGLGLGRAMMEACIECAKEAGYEQMELEVVAENERAIALYEKVGFVEFGRNPKAFKSRLTGDQTLVLMRLEL